MVGIIGQFFKFMPMEIRTVESRFELDCTHLVPLGPLLLPAQAGAQHSTASPAFLSHAKGCPASHVDGIAEEMQVAS